MKLVPSALRIWFAGPFDITSVPVPFNVTAPAARGLERRGGRGAGQSDGSVVGIGAHASKRQGAAILNQDVAAGGIDHRSAERSAPHSCLDRGPGPVVYNAALDHRAAQQSHGPRPQIVDVAAVHRRLAQSNVCTRVSDVAV